MTLPTRQQFICDSPESTVLQDRLRMNCAADARVLFEIELPAISLPAQLAEFFQNSESPHSYFYSGGNVSGTSKLELTKNSPSIPPASSARPTL